MSDVDDYKLGEAVRAFIENKLASAPVWFGENELDRAVRHLRNGKPEKSWLGSLRNKVQRCCDMSPKVRSTRMPLPVAPCRAKADGKLRDMPDRVWTELGLGGRPKLDHRGVAAHGWVVAKPETPIELLRWFEHSATSPA